jgi:hypothetical protein
VMRGPGHGEGQKKSRVLQVPRAGLDTLSI